MPCYEYTGQLSSGTAITGTFDAPGVNEARGLLCDMQIRETSLTQVPRVRSVRPLSREDLHYFNQQLASLAESGIALDQGLRVVAQDIRRGRLRRVMEDLADDLEQGVPLEKAIERRGGRFPPLYAQVLKAGMGNNQLASTLFNLNTHLSRMESTRQLFWESAIYPIVVIGLGVILITFFMMNVVPEFEQLINDMASAEDWGTYYSYSGAYSQIPLLTRWMIDVSHYWQTIMLSSLGGAILLIVALTMLRRSKTGRSLRETMILLTPGLAGVYRSSLIARFANAGALGAKAGQPLPDLLRMAAQATGSAGLIREADRLGRHVEAGGLPEQSAAQSRMIPAIFGYAAHIAGGRGQLAEALADLARNYDALSRHRLAMMKMYLMPLLIILTALIIGTGILALFYPIIQIINSLSSY